MINPLLMRVRIKLAIKEMKAFSFEKFRGRRAFKNLDIGAKGIAPSTYSIIKKLLIQTPDLSLQEGLRHGEWECFLELIYYY